MSTSRAAAGHGRLGLPVLRDGARGPPRDGAHVPPGPAGAPRGRAEIGGVVRGSHLGLEIDVSTFRSVQDTFRRSNVFLRCFTHCLRVVNYPDLAQPRWTRLMARRTATRSWPLSSKRTPWPTAWWFQRFFVQKHDFTVKIRARKNRHPSLRMLQKADHFSSTINSN